MISAENSELQTGSGHFPETADVETSSDDYASRFSGATGEWMLELQASITTAMLKGGPPPVASVLDVGGGHGQLAVPLCRGGFTVTVLGSSESCRRRISEIADSGKCTFVVGNVIELPFSDRSFDIVVSFRMLTHCSRWPKLIDELCRVAKYSVIVDYPTSESLNRIAPMLFKAKRKLEGNTRTWTLFRHAEVLREFAKHGFALQRRQAQFFLPMVLHRALNCRRLSVVLESFCRLICLTRLWGSPVIVKMVRTEDNSAETRGHA